MATDSKPSATLHDLFVEIQQELKAPKNKKAHNARFNYRSAEDIFSVAKPLANQRGCSLRCTDSAIEIAGRAYIKAEAILSNGEQELSSAAVIKEDPNNKNMNPQQDSGSTSSYARKVALAGLFAIDNEDDPDSQPQPDEAPADVPVSSQPAPQYQGATPNKFKV